MNDGFLVKKIIQVFFSYFFEPKEVFDPIGDSLEMISFLKRIIMNSSKKKKRRRISDL